MTAHADAGPRAAAPRIPALADLDTLPVDMFVDAITPLFEGASRFLRRLAAARPFGDASTLFERAQALAVSLPEAEAIELVNAHPPLGARPGSVSALSYVEQGYDRDAGDRRASHAESEAASGADPEAGHVAADPEAGHVAADPEAGHVAAELARLNAAYEARFGFRYCVFVAGRSRVDLLPGMEAALVADRASELRRALVDIVRIAEDRHRRLRPEEWA